MNPKKQITISQIKLENIHPHYLWLINRLMDDYKFGEVTIIMADGVPQRIKSAVKNDDPRDYQIIKEL